jgi:hypothetical protein
MLPSSFVLGAKDFTYKPIDTMISESYIMEPIKFKMMRQVEWLWLSSLVEKYLRVIIAKCIHAKILMMYVNSL